MKRRLHDSVLLIVTLAISSAGAAQSSSRDSLANPVQVQILNFTLEDFSTTKLVIGVGLAAASNRNITVDQLVLSGLRVNGVPIYAAPLKRRFKLRSDARVSLPEPLSITIYLRDLDSLAPLRNAISDGHATVDGVVVIHVPLSPLARLMLLSTHAEVSTVLHQQVPFSVPGGPMAATSLVKILDLADAALKALDSTITGATKLSRR
jgi:hypothetical protein